jgi:diguanylate cyclase (GGDEF)-like protein
LSAAFSFSAGILPSVIGIWWLKKRASHIAAGVLSNLGSSTALFLISFTTGGVTSAVLPWLLIPILGCYIQLGKLSGNLLVIYTVSLYSMIGLYAFLGLPTFYELPFSQSSQSYLFFIVINFVLSAGIISVGILVYSRQFEKAYRSYQESEKKVKELNESLYLLAHVDELTGIYNRRALLEIANNEIRRATRSRGHLLLLKNYSYENSSESQNNTEVQFKATRRIKDYIGALSVALLDIDHFKKINDTFGHDVGDQVLVQFAKTLKQSFRETDVVGRYGGEEFVVIFPETSAELAKMALEKLSANLKSNPIHLNDGRTLPVTFSGGYTELPHKNETFDELLKRCDLALYQAKESGRNCLVLGSC